MRIIVFIFESSAQHVLFAWWQIIRAEFAQRKELLVLTQVVAV